MRVFLLLFIRHCPALHIFKALRNERERKKIILLNPCTHKIRWINMETSCTRWMHLWISIRNDFAFFRVTRYFNAFFFWLLCVGSFSLTTSYYECNTHTSTHNVCSITIAAKTLIHIEVSAQIALQMHTNTHFACTTNCFLWFAQWRYYKVCNKFKFNKSTNTKKNRKKGNMPRHSKSHEMMFSPVMLFLRVHATDWRYSNFSRSFLFIFTNESCECIANGR